MRVTLRCACWHLQDRWFSNSKVSGIMRSTITAAYHPLLFANADHSSQSLWRERDSAAKTKSSSWARERGRGRMELSHRSTAGSSQKHHQNIWRILYEGDEVNHYPRGISPRSWRHHSERRNDKIIPQVKLWDSSSLSWLRQSSEIFCTLLGNHHQWKLVWMYKFPLIFRRWPAATKHNLENTASLLDALWKVKGAGKSLCLEQPMCVFHPSSWVTHSAIATSLNGASAMTIELNVAASY